MKGFVVRTMLLSVCFLLCKLEVNNQCNQSPIESRNWNFLAFYEKVCWYNLNSIEKTVLRSNGLCRTWYYSQFGLYDNSTGVILKIYAVLLFSNIFFKNLGFHIPDLEHHNYYLVITISYSKYIDFFSNRFIAHYKVKFKNHSYHIK